MLFTKLNSTWISSRRKVIFSILIEILVYFIIFFGTIFKKEIFSLDLLFNQSIILMLWVFISYILGRYNFASNYLNKKPFYNFLITIFSFLIFIFSKKIISIIFFNFYLLNFFYLRFIFFLTISSLFINLFIFFY